MGKYYAVRAGREPGIYRTWEECEQQVSGFKGARFKGFRTHEAAEVFMQGGNDRPRHELGHERKRASPRREKTGWNTGATREERKQFHHDARRTWTHEETGRKPPKNLYSGTRPPWEYPTFIECIDPD